MLSLYVEGLLLGTVCAFFVGPVLFTLLDASIQGGFRAGARVALGIAFSDAVAIALVVLGLGPLLTHPVGEQILGILGGLILLGFGAALAFQADKVTASHETRPVRWPFWTGFAVNFVNPFVFSFWVGAVGGVGSSRGWTLPVLVPTFAGMVSTILVTDLAKAGTASLLTLHLTGSFLTRARRLSGLLLALAGLGLLLRSLIHTLPDT